MDWIFHAAEPDSALSQGDVLLPQESLLKALREVHPHFCNSKYLGFMLLTQSCDLLQRGADRACKAPHLEICTIRALDDYIFSILDAECAPVAPGIYSDSDKPRARDLLTRVFNQNEQALGLFYIHQAPDVTGLVVPAIAVLRVSVALRTEHYEMLRQCRTASMDPAYAAKLGWLVGNLYSRVGVDDWHDSGKGGEFGDLLEDYLGNRGSTVPRPKWLPSAKIAAALALSPNLADLPREDALTLLEKAHFKTSMDMALESVLKQATKVLERALVEPHPPADLATKIANRLRSDPTFARLLR